jgi:hypothetical protein
MLERWQDGNAMAVSTGYSDDQMQELMRWAGDRAEQRYRLAVRPIYEISKEHHCQHVGSSVLLGLAGKSLIVTAAHVVDGNPQASLYVAGDSRFVALNAAAFFDTEPPNGIRGDDHFDVAFRELSPEEVSALGAVMFVAESECVPAPGDAQGCLYTAIGFPNSRNKGPWQNGKVGGRRYQYTAGARLEPEIARALGVSGRVHLFIDHQKVVHDETGRRGRPIKPVGLSGGPVIETRVSQGKVLAPRLAAITIESKKSHKVLVATKIGMIIEGIKDALSLTRDI